MMGLGQRPMSDEARAAKTLRASRFALERQHAKRLAAMKVLAASPAGSGPMPGLDEKTLWSLVHRGLAERRYVLTREGRAELEREGQA